MGLAAFNRMRLQQVEEMKPENIQKKQEEVQKPIEQVEEPTTQDEETARRRPTRRHN